MYTHIFYIYIPISTNNGLCGLRVHGSKELEAPGISLSLEALDLLLADPAHLRGPDQGQGVLALLICAYIYIYEHIFIYIYTHIHVYVCTHLCMHACMYKHVHLHMHTCIH